MVKYVRTGVQAAYCRLTYLIKLKGRILEAVLEEGGSDGYNKEALEKVLEAVLGHCVATVQRFLKRRAIRQAILKFGSLTAMS